MSSGMRKEVSTCSGFSGLPAAEDDIAVALGVNAVVPDVVAVVALNDHDLLQPDTFLLCSRSPSSTT